MRHRRSSDEAAAIEEVRSALSAAGHMVIDDEAITDNPDWVFDIDGWRVAAECTCINLPRLMEWAGYGKRRELGKHYEVRFANEPHLWVKRAIEAKDPKIGVYKERARCDAVWLVMHSDFSAMPLFGCSPRMLGLMRAAAGAVIHRFETVWFVHPEAGAHRLWRQGDPKCEFSELEISGDYPTLYLRQGAVTLSPSDGEFSLGPHNAATRLLIQPLDLRFKLSE